MIRPIPRPILGARSFVVSGLAALLSSGATAAYALPSGYIFAGSGGGATVDSSIANQLTVNQPTSRVVIDWNSFNIASNEKVIFSQAAGKGAIAFNVVTTPGQVTTISGSLSANGGVWLFSPAGIVFGPTAKVSTGSFLASTGIFNSAAVTQADNGSDTIQIASQGTPAPGGAVSIDVEDGATIGATAGFVLLHSPTLTVGNADISATDAVIYTADNDVQVQFATSASGVTMVDESSASGTPSDSHIDYTGSTTAGSYVEFDAAEDVATDSGYGGVINLSGHVAANGIKNDTANPASSGNGFSVILDGDSAGNDSQTEVTTLDASGGDITAKSGIYANAGLIKTGLWTNNGGQVAVSGGGVDGGVDVDQSLTSNGAGLVSIAGRNVAINDNVIAAGSMSIVSFDTQVGPNVIVQAGASIPGSALLVKSTGDITADAKSSFFVGPSLGAPTGSLTIAAGATIGPQDDPAVGQTYAGTGGDLTLGAAGGTFVSLQATPLGGAGGTLDLEGPVQASGSVFMSASQLRLGASSAIAAGLTSGVANAGQISTGSGSVNIVLQNAAAPAVLPAAAGDIVLGAPVSWTNPGGQLSLDAYHSVLVTAPMNVGGSGSQVSLNTNYNNSGTSGDYSFVNGGSLSFTAGDSSQSLIINGVQYTLIYTQADLLNINNSDNGVGGLGGNYALAGPLDFNTANAATVFTGAPIASTVYAPFTGTFTGLGNTISNLDIQAVTPVGQVTNSNYSTNGALGLFGVVGYSGVVRDVNLSNATVSGGDGFHAGALVGDLDGLVENASSSGQIATGGAAIVDTGAASGAAFAMSGGLVGLSDGQIINSHSSASVSGDGVVGGLVGMLLYTGSIANSSASGPVTAGDFIFTQPSAGGLVGQVQGYNTSSTPLLNNTPSASITGSSATGSVTGGYGSFVGGLAGQVTEASIAGSFATGAVSGGSSSSAGGFAGALGSGQVTTSYATGTVGSSDVYASPDAGQNFAGGFVGQVQGGETITLSYATGAVTADGAPFLSSTTDNLVGGFAGEVTGLGSSVSNAYALGSVTVTGAYNSNANIGGFAGAVVSSGSVDHVYATGAVSGGGCATIGGLVGELGDPVNNDPTTTISDSYWDEGTTGASTPIGGGYGVPTDLTPVGGTTGLSPYAAASYTKFFVDEPNTWVLVEGVTRPMLQSEYSTTITNAHQLQLMELHPDADYTLASDIDASATSAAAGGLWNPATGFSPVGGNGEAAFTGTFDGQGHTISGLSITYTTAYSQSPAPGLTTDGAVGLFGLVGSTGVIENVNLVDAHVVGGAGMLVGSLVGGLFGTVDYASSSQSAQGSALVQVGDELGSVTANAGGLVGASAGLIVNSHASVTVQGGDAFAGGLLGTGGGSGLIVNSYATGAVSVTAYPAGGVDSPAAGGLVGEFSGSGKHSGGGIVASYATGAVSGGAGSSVGGFVGSLDDGVITDSYATGAVTQTAGGVTGSTSAAGGFAGSIEDGAQVNNAYASGDVNSQAAGANNFTRAGGFAGQIEGEGTGVYDAYALGSVTINGSGAGTSPAGGFAGAIDGDGEADHVYATGFVTGIGSMTGGLVGQVGSTDGSVQTGGSIFDSYWDVGTTGQGVMSGANAGSTQATIVDITGIGGSTGLSPYAQATYANFFPGSDWFMIEGATRPILQSEYSADITNAHQLQLMDLHLGANYTLANDIDASATGGASDIWNPATGFSPIGAGATAPFTGTFDGRGQTISGLTLIGVTGAKQSVDGVTTTGAVGLFGFAGPTASISNVNLVNGYASGGDGMSVGLLVGSLSGAVTNATSSGVVSAGNGVDPAASFANASAGGLVGSLSHTGSVKFSSSSASVTGGQASVGGLVGEMDGGDIETSFATGSVTDGAYANAQVPAAGGLVGAALVTGGYTPTISGSYATGDVHGGGSSDAGGFIGLSQGTISTSYAIGTVDEAAAASSGVDLAGGFAGEISGGAVSQSFSTGTVTVTVTNPSAAAEVGGFVGELVNGGVITNAYSTSPTTAMGCVSNVGGFAGEILDTSSATDFYATGYVTTNANGGGLVGKLGGTIVNGYWDEGTTGRSNSVYTVAGGSRTNIVGMNGCGTFVDPFNPGTYVGFDFQSTWSTPSDGVYPQLYGVSHVLQLTASADPITYGNFPVYTVTATGLQAGDTFTSAVQTFQVGPLLDQPGIAYSGYYDVGSYGLSVSNVAATGPIPQSGPYRIIYNDSDASTNDGGTLTINPASLTISAFDDEKTYDGGTSSLAMPTYSGLVPGDSIACLTESYDNPNAGSNHVLTVNSGFSVQDGNDGNNYTVGPLGTATGIIDQLGLEVSLQGTVEKTYDGTTSATLNAENYVFQGGLSGDDVSLNIVTSGYYNDPNAAIGKTVTVTHLTLSGASAGNYFLEGLGSASGAIGTIDQAPLTLTAQPSSKPYDGTTSSSQAVVYSGLIPTDTI
ncbi:MAG TPA: GLUG motif-containing protein, partial [Caulobacteraceae bacterium]|nr:GLUG motif-containing protein [Caulobacteraceae bacterium]